MSKMTWCFAQTCAEKERFACTSARGKGGQPLGVKGREHENGINCVHPNNMWDFVPAPTQKCLIWQIRRVFPFGRKIWGSEPPNYCNLDLFFDIYVFCCRQFPGNDGWHLHAQRQNYCATQFLMVDYESQNDLMARANQCGETTFGSVKVPEHENATNCVQSNNMWDFVPAPTTKCWIWRIRRVFPSGRKIWGSEPSDYCNLGLFFEIFVFLPSISCKRRLACSCAATKLLCDWRFACPYTRGASSGGTKFENMKMGKIAST